MQTRLSKLQKYILVYIGVWTKKRNISYLRKKETYDGIKDQLGKHSDSFNVVLSNSIKALYKRGLISIRGKSVGLTTTGRNTAKEILQQVKEKYENVNWETLKMMYEI